MQWKEDFQDKLFLILRQKRLLKPVFQWVLSNDLVLELNIPNYFIGGYLGSDELGYFSSMFHLVIASDIIVNS